MRRIFARSHWQRWEVAMRVFDRYISSRWLWLSPILEPLQEHLQEMQSLQCTLMTQILKLYVPQHLTASQAGGLNRVRRRAILEVYRLRCPSMLWTHAWLSRKFSYAGHLLRRLEHHKAKVELLTPLHQQRDGRASTYQRWILNTCRRRFDCPHLTVDMLKNLYLDKSSWLALIPAVQEQHGLTLQHCKHPISAGTWERWRDPFLSSTSWFQAVLMWYEHGLYCFKWLSVEDGWMELSFQTSLADAVLSFLLRLAILRGRMFYVQLLISDSCPSGETQECQEFVHKANSGHVWACEMPVLGLEYLCSTWVAKVVSL